MKTTPVSRCNCEKHDAVKDGVRINHENAGVADLCKVLGESRHCLN